MKSVIALLLIASVCLGEVGDVCSTGKGTGVCISTSDCAARGGKSTAGKCHGTPSNIQCCTNILCNNNKGICMAQSSCVASGTPVSGQCPGNSQVTCCSEIKCDGGKGVCKKTTDCTGSIKTGICPGPSGFACCESSGPGPHPGGGEAIVKAAQAQVDQGWPYSWGGGNRNGATYGSIEPDGPKCDDRKVKGFDCSGLSLYALWQGVGVSVGHGATMQWNAAPKYPYSQRQPGDLIFYGTDTKIHHVTIYAGNDQMLEAEGHDSHCRGLKLHKTAVRSKNLKNLVGRFY